MVVVGSLLNERKLVYRKGQPTIVIMEPHLQKKYISIQLPVSLSVARQPILWQ